MKSTSPPCKPKGLCGCQGAHNIDEELNDTKKKVNALRLMSVAASQQISALVAKGESNL